MFKAAAIAPLIGMAWGAGGPVLLIAALALCLFGDVMLVFEDERRFLIGVAAFAMGHVAYVWLFLTHEQGAAELIIQMPFVLHSVLLIGIAACVAPILFKSAGALRFAVLGYVPMIVALGIAGMGFAYSLPLVTIGALLFVASDLVLGLEMFILKSGTWVAKLAPFWVWATYWSAQICLVVGLT